MFLICSISSRMTVDMRQAHQKDQSEQMAFPHPGPRPGMPAEHLAEDLLATLRQCFLFNPGKQNPMHILALIEDHFPDTEKDCDFLRLSLQMAKDMGNDRVRPMRRLHCERIAQLMRGKEQVAGYH
jgi:hypothetical protein